VQLTFVQKHEPRRVFRPTVTPVRLEICGQGQAKSLRHVTHIHASRLVYSLELNCADSVTDQLNNCPFAVLPLMVERSDENCQSIGQIHGPLES